VNKQLKIVAISGILVVIAGIAVAASLDQAEALTKAQGTFTQKFGAATAGIVCGDRLCSEAEGSNNMYDIEEDTPIGSIRGDDDAAPTVKLLGIDKYQASTAKESDITYRITFSVTANKENLRNIEFEIHSDITSTTFEIASLNALKTSVNVVRVKAIDSDSITGELIGYTISGPTSSVPGAPR